MIIKLCLFLCISLSAYGENLSQVIDLLQNSKKVKALEEKTNSQVLSNELKNAYEAPNFDLSFTEVRLDDKSDNGLEYGLGISQSIAHPFASKQKDAAVKFTTNSIRQEFSHELHLLELDVASIYHSACLSQELERKAATLYEEQSKIFTQLERSYALGEISKKTLYLNKLELLKLLQEINTFKHAYSTELHSLVAYLDNTPLQELSCNDLLPIAKDIELRSVEEHDEVKKISFEKSAAEANYRVYDASLQNISYSLGYEKELDASRYGVAFSIPISSLTQKNEKEKKEYLHQSSQLNFQKDALMQEIVSNSKSLVLKLQTLYDEYALVENEILPLNQELLKLSKSAFLEGESSAMEYLYISRTYSEYFIKNLQIKKEYYNLLFELYKNADLELGEQYEKK